MGLQGAHNQQKGFEIICRGELQILLDIIESCKNTTY